MTTSYLLHGVSILPNHCSGKESGRVVMEVRRRRARASFCAGGLGARGCLSSLNTLSLSAKVRVAHVVAPFLYVPWFTRRGLVH